MPDTARDELVGKRLREYELLECIGKGGMAKVYKARHHLLDELRAIKLLRPEVSEGSEEFKARFQREAKILSRIHHRHLVTVHEFGILGKNVLFMVMEYLEGESLRKRLTQSGWIAVPEAIEVTKQVALGLSAAHAQGVVHRDVSPDNIVLVEDRGDEVAKVIDFGIAKALVATGSAKLTDTMKFVGKAEYCSPEQIQMPLPGDEIDGRSDIYSLGITLFEILTGARPFKAKSPQGLIAKHLKSEPLPFEEVNPRVSIPRSLEGLVMRMLDKDRTKRPASMDELFLELTALGHEHPVPTPAW